MPKKVRPGSKRLPPWQTPQTQCRGSYSRKMSKKGVFEQAKDTFSLQLGWEEMQPIGALIRCGAQGKPPHRHALPDGRQVGGPAPRRAPLPRRRVRRGCADPAPPAGPSGAAGSGQPLGTLRSPPRPRGGANRAGERAPPLFLLEPPGPVAQRT